MNSFVIPIKFLTIPYNDKAYPGSVIANAFKNGANCQHFIYEIFRYNGLDVPNFRSSELWEDKIYTEKVNTFIPLDILFFNDAASSWGAHVGIYLGKGNVIHLSETVGYPAIWNLKAFQKWKKYKVVLGAKRLKSL